MSTTSSPLSQLDALLGLNTESRLSSRNFEMKVRGETLPTQDVIPGTLHNVTPCETGPAKGGKYKEKTFEQFWHKTAAILLATGMLPSQVAEHVGKHVNTVEVLVRTPWFQEMVSKIITDNGGKDMLEVFRKDATEAHELLVELRKNEKTPVQYRVKLATDAVERYYGKATQRIEHGEITSSDPVEEAARLKREIERLRAAQAPGLS